VAYLVENNLVDFVRVADKVLPATAYLSERHKKALLENKRVEFKQANLVNAASTEKVFSLEDGKTFDYVFNCAAETKYGQSEEVYDEKVYQLTVTVAKEAAKRNVKVFVELSTAQVYESDKKPSDEESKLKPWTTIAKFKLKAENEIQKIPNLNLIIVRPAIVYGSGDFSGITSRLITGAVYRHLKEEMKLLWTKDLKMNTVHISDVVNALWMMTATKEEKGGRNGPVTKCEIYNLADKGDTNQGIMNDFIKEIFGISTGFQGTMISQLAKLNLESITEDVNDKHLQPWSELCKNAGVLNTPLTPYLDKELLKDNALSVDGSKVEKEFGFSYKVVMNLECLKAVIADYVAMKIWPSETTK
jgi:nucleoside-diphosphate-sugar epimerase